MYLFIKRKSDGKILHSCSTQTIDNPDHMASAETFLTSKGFSLADYEIADSTRDGVTTMIKDAITPMKAWENDMRGTDSGMPRYLEDLITDNSNLIIHENMKTRYDEKIELRATKP